MRRLLRFLLLFGALAGAIAVAGAGAAAPGRPGPPGVGRGPLSGGGAAAAAPATTPEPPAAGPAARPPPTTWPRCGASGPSTAAGSPRPASPPSPPWRPRLPPRWPRPPESPKNAPPAGSPRPPPSARADRPVPYLTAPDELGRAAPRRAPLPGAPVPRVALSLPGADRSRHDQSARGPALSPGTAVALHGGSRTGGRPGPDGEVAPASARRRLVRGGAHGLPAAYDAVPLQPGGLRHGVHLLRHRPVRLRAAPGSRGDGGASRLRRCPPPGPAPARTRPSAWATSSSWAWASRWPTTRTCGRRCTASSAEMGLSARAITVSTVGVVPGIRRLAAEPWPVTLALSLHAADDDTRAALVPLNRRYPIDEILAAARVFAASKGRRVTLEWTLIAGVNDTPEQARGLAAIAAELRAHANVIPLNPTPLTRYRPPSPERVRAFVDQVAARRRQRHLPRHSGARHRRRLRPVALPPGGRDPLRGSRRETPAGDGLGPAAGQETRAGDGAPGRGPAPAATPGGSSPGGASPNDSRKPGSPLQSPSRSYAQDTSHRPHFPPRARRGGPVGRPRLPRRPRRQRGPGAGTGARVRGRSRRPEPGRRHRRLAQPGGVPADHPGAGHRGRPRLLPRPGGGLLRDRRGGPRRPGHGAGPRGAPRQPVRLVGASLLRRRGPHPRPGLRLRRSRPHGHRRPVGVVRESTTPPSPARSPWPTVW